MKKKLLVLIMSLEWLSSNSQTDLKYLMIHSKDGNNFAYSLEQTPKIRFAEDKLFISTGNTNEEYFLEDLSYITYESCDTKVENLKSDIISYQITPEALIVNVPQMNSKVTIFSIKGENIETRVIQRRGECSFSLSKFEPGIYVVKIDDLAFKFEKR